jgi:hypothetical protein
LSVLAPKALRADGAWGTNLAALDLAPRPDLFNLSVLAALPLWADGAWRTNRSVCGGMLHDFGSIGIG